MSEITTAKTKTSAVKLHADELSAAIIEGGQSWAKPSRKVNRQPKPRSEQQRRLDAQAADLHKRWLAAGQPRDMDASPKAQYMVSPDHVEAFKAMIRKTAHNGGSVPGKSVRIREHADPSGRIAVTVAVWDRLAGEK